MLSPLAQHVTRRPQRIALLAQIAEQGSITRAAKAAGLSYKAAWDAIDELNNLAGQPLVARSVGGKGGGGARLTLEGERLLTLYRRLEALSATVLGSVGQAEDLDRLNRLMLQTSARNQLHGEVVSITPQGHNDLIAINLPGPLPVQARITHESTERLNLAPGRNVIVLIKASWLTLHEQVPAATPNALRGRVDSVTPAEAGPAELRLTLPNGQTLCVLLPENTPLNPLPGQDLTACFAPDQVLLGSPL
ncbi:molybdate transport system regulatory protein [Pseudomonas duriflava]|uniref:Molybdate transport system regulatory protein n=1 Tax=Pseudomonas duriflava TaxID=459528 RepID=A0A562QL23_9PSED|nr:TOBE domain-containing protein [Pseudomonas duriflava]TWI56746.1 molybdate transport system regulatory protein [Pseudomonas duriflava]